MKNIKDCRLYLITSQEYSNNRPTLEIVHDAISGGIDALQLREKNMPDNHLAQLAKKISTLCKKNNIVFIINDNPYLAEQVNADGVHLGQEDIKNFPVAKVRDIIGKDKLIGLSTHCLTDIEKANALDINYIGFGPLFYTKTKNYTIGAENITKALKLSRFPIVFIGGINNNNITGILKKGVKTIAMIRAITENANITEKVREIQNIIQNENNYKRQTT